MTMRKPVGYIYALGTDQEMVFAPEDITVVWPAPPTHVHRFPDDISDLCSWNGCEMTYDRYRAEVQEERDKG